MADGHNIILSCDWLCSWEAEGCLTVIPGNPRSVARQVRSSTGISNTPYTRCSQFLRVCLQQLSSNGVFPLLFQLDLADTQRRLFYSTIVRYPARYLQQPG